MKAENKTIELTFNEYDVEFSEIVAFMDRMRTDNPTVPEYARIAYMVAVVENTIGAETLEAFEKVLSAFFSTSDALRSLEGDEQEKNAVMHEILSEAYRGALSHIVGVVNVLNDKPFSIREQSFFMRALECFTVVSNESSPFKDCAVFIA